MKAALVVLALALTLLTGCAVAPVAPDEGYGDAYGSPPPIAFQTPPEVVVMPDAEDVYVVPDVAVDLFFWNGFWWRPWEGRWYRSPYYDRGWAYYNNVPGFYFDVDPHWRTYYRERNWYGHRWNYDRIPYNQLHNNWKGWHDNRHWERQGTWGVQGYKPRPVQQRQELRRERQDQYQKRPDVQRHQQSMRDQKPQGQPKPQGQIKPQVQGQPKPQSQGQQGPQPQGQPKPQGQIKPQVQGQQGPQPQVQPKPQIQPKPQPQVQPKPQVQPQPKPQVQPKPQPQVQPKPKPQPNAQPHGKPNGGEAGHPK